MQKLDKRQQKFCRIYVRMKVPNATEACRQAGYSAKTDNSLAVQGSVLLREPKIQEYISELEEKFRAQYDKEGEDLRKLLTAIAFQDPRKLHEPGNQNDIVDITSLSDEDAMAIEGVQIADTMFGRKVKVTKASRLAAAEMLLRMRGDFEKDNKQKAQPINWNIKL